jgi:hypothetical protein
MLFTRCGLKNEKSKNNLESKALPLDMMYTHRYTPFMMRAQIYLPEGVHTKLNHLAGVRKEPMAQIVREYIEEGLHRDQARLKGNAHFLLKLAEMAETEEWSGPSDLAENHDK